MDKNEDLEVVSQKEDSKLDTQVKDTGEIVSHDKTIALILAGMAIFNFFYDTCFSDVKNCLSNTKTSGKKLLVVLITFFHHFLAVFGLFGWLFNNKKILMTYVILITITIIQWKINKGHCVITRAVSKLSDTPKYKRFNDFYQIIGLKKLIPSRWLYYVSLSIFIGIALYKIYFT